MGVVFGIIKPHMSKLRKKRNKPYRGADASLKRPVVTRISAENRSTAKQWWLEKKPVAKPLLIALSVVSVAALLIFEVIRLLTGAA